MSKHKMSKFKRLKYNRSKFIMPNVQILRFLISTFWSLIFKFWHFEFRHFEFEHFVFWHFVLWPFWVSIFDISNFDISKCSHIWIYISKNIFNFRIYLIFPFLIHLAENSGLRFEPNEIQVDFEIATIKAIENLFPNCIVKGCLFHFTQAIWRKVQNLGLVRFYNTDIRARKLIYRIMGLA